MLSLLRDPLWQFVGALLALMALGLSVWAYKGQKRRKCLLVERVARIPLVTHGSKGITGIEVRFQDRHLRDALVVLVHVHSFGNEAIVADDFESPLKLQFEDGSSVLAADVVETVPEGIPVALTCSGSCALVSKQLLNAGDSFTARLLVENSKGTLTATGRIAGVSKIVFSRRTSIVSTGLAGIGLIIMVVSIFLAPSLREIRDDDLPFLGGAILGTGLLFASLFYQVRSLTWTLRKRFLRDA